MSFSPSAGAFEIASDDIFMPEVRCKLDSQFLDVRESVKSENMCVFARVRPMLPREEAKGFKECIAVVDEKTVRVVVPVTSARYKNSRQSEELIEDYYFTAAFGPDTGQFVFFQETMLNSMQNFVEGSNSLIFSYGITGSGKTYSLQGNSENPGIIPLSLRLYFAVVEKQLMQEIKVKPHMYNNIVGLSDAEKKQEYSSKMELLSLYDDECDIVPGSFNCQNSKTFAMTLCDLFSDEYECEERQTTLGAEDMASAQAATLMKEVIKKSADNLLGVCSVWVSFVEIYNENIFDLLQPFTSGQRKKLSLGEDKNGNVYIKGAREVFITTGQEALKVLNIGRKQLNIASTKMNYQSSRSHCIYTIRVVRVPDVNNISHGTVNRLSFCDLAGSERAAKTQTSGIRLKEAGSINTSLLVLGRCLEQLRMNQMGREKRLVPFRESKLTRIFSGFFMGQGKAVMLANASPSDYTFDETLHVLKFSAVARKLLVNDTFFSSASSTLQSICQQLGQLNSSASFCDESLESIDSDTDIIQKKDELIEKLLDIATKFAQREKEMSDFEVRIRRDICQEFSDYTDQLLENNRNLYEEQMESLRETYKKRLVKMEKMYENILNGLHNQLTEGDESSEESLDESKSLVDLDESAGSRPSRRSIFLESDPEKLKKAIHTRNIELESLQRDLKSMTNELQKTKEELTNYQKTTSNLEMEKEEFKNVANTLEKEIKELKVIIERSNVNKVTDKAEMDTLKENGVELQNKLIVASELEKELRKEIKRLEKDFQDIEMKSEEAEEKYSANRKVMEEKLLSTQLELCATKEQRENKSLLISELEKEKKIDENEIASLRRQLSEASEKNKEIFEENKSKVQSLEQDIASLRNELSNKKEELDNSTLYSKELLSEKQNYEKEIASMRRQLSEAPEKNKEIIERNKSEVQNLEQDIASLRNELTKKKEELDNEIFTSNELLAEKENYEKEIASMRRQLSEASERNNEIFGENKLTVHNLELDIASLQNELRKKKEELENEILTSKELLSEKQYYEKEIVSMKMELSEASTKNKELFEENKSKVQNLEQDIASLRKELSKKNEELENEISTSKELLSEKQNYEKEIASIRRQLSEASEKNKEIFEESKSKVQSLEQDIASLQNQLRKKEEELENEILISKELLSEKKKYENEIALMKKQLLEVEISDEKKSMVQNFERDITSLQNELSKKKEELENSTLYSKELLLEIETVKAKYVELQSSSKQLTDSNQNDIEKLKGELSTLQQEFFDEKQNYEKEIASMRRQLEVYEANKEIFEENKSKVQNLEQDIASLRNELRKKEEELENEISTSKELLSEKQYYEKEIVSMKRELSEASTKNKELFEENKSKVQNLEQDMASLRKELSKQKEELENEISTSKELLSEKQNYEKEIASMRRQLSEASEKNKEIFEESKSKVQSLEQDIASLQNQLKKKEEELENEILISKELLSEKQNYESEIASMRKQLSEASEKSKELFEENKSKVQNLEQDIASLESEKEDELQNALLSSKELLSEIEIVKAKTMELQSSSKEFSDSSSYQNDIEKFKRMISTLQRELQAANKNTDIIKKEMKVRETVAAELEKEIDMHKQEIDILNENVSEKEGIEKKLSAVSHELEVTKDYYMQMSSKLCEMKNIYSPDLEIEKHKDPLSEKMEMEEEFALTEKILKAIKVSICEKDSKLENLQNQCNMYESEIQELKQNEEAKILDLEEKIIVASKELEELKKEIEQKSSNLLQLESQLDDYKVEVNKLKEDCQNLQSEKVKVEEEADCYKVKIKELEEDNNEKIEKCRELSDLQKEITVYKQDIKKMKDNQQLTELEKQDLMIIISNNEEKMEELEEKLSEVNEELKIAKTSLIDDLQNYSSELLPLLDILERCELKATDRIKNLDNSIAEQNYQIKDCYRQIRDKEANIEELEKALCDLQVQMKEVKASYDQKIASEKEQHVVEIEQIMQIKHDTEEENMNLKKENSRLKSSNEVMLKDKHHSVASKEATQRKPPIERNISQKKVNSKPGSMNEKKSHKLDEISLKKNVRTKEKENLPKTTSTRSSQKAIKMKDFSFSCDAESASSKVNIRKNRKRASDEDFVPDSERAAKKMKPEASKIPRKRTLRGKLEVEKVENQSPVQKIANTIRDKMKVISDNVASHISSPRLTRGRKKLFNPEAPSTASNKVTKGRTT